MGCQNGVDIAFHYTQQGAYLFELVVDGVPVTCKAQIPLSRDQSGSACTQDGIYLGLSGSMLPVASQSIGGITLSTVAAKEITLSAERDGVPLGKSHYTVTYDVRPGPNGPACEPAECRLAKLSFP